MYILSKSAHSVINDVVHVRKNALVKNFTWTPKGFKNSWTLPFTNQPTNGHVGSTGSCTSNNLTVQQASFILLGGFLQTKNAFECYFIMQYKHQCIYCVLFIWYMYINCTYMYNMYFKFVTNYKFYYFFYSAIQKALF